MGIVRSLIARICWLSCLALGVGVAPAADGQQSLRLGIVPYIGDATQFHALQRGYFEDGGLHMVVAVNALGVDSFNQLRHGELDIATAETTPVVFAAVGLDPDRAGFRIVASALESTRLHSIIAMDGAGIASVMDLPGHRMALSRGTVSEYYWHMVALSHGIDVGRVALVDIPVPDMAKAVRAGRIDAAVTFMPHDTEVLAATAGKGRRLPTGPVITTSRLVVVSRQALSGNPEAVVRYLRALARAERDFKADPGAVAASFADATGLSGATLSGRYGALDFDLSLTESLIVGMHQQAVWASGQGLAAGAIPDFRAYLAPEPLRSLNPGAVRLLQ